MGKAFITTSFSFMSSFLFFERLSSRLESRLATDPGAPDSFRLPLATRGLPDSLLAYLRLSLLTPSSSATRFSPFLNPRPVYPHLCPALSFKLVHDPRPNYTPRLYPGTTSIDQTVPQSVHHALQHAHRQYNCRYLPLVPPMYHQQHPAGSFLFTGAPPDSPFQSFTQTFGAPTMGGYTYELPTPPSSPPVIIRPQGGVRLQNVPLPPEQYPITIDQALTGPRAYLLGIDLAMPLSRHLLSSPLLAAPATSPRVTEIRIVHHSLHHAIFIRAAPEVGYIRIYDVIVAIHGVFAPTLMATTQTSLPGTKFVGLTYDVARSNRLLGTQDKYQDRTWILMTHDQFVAVSH